MELSLEYHTVEDTIIKSGATIQASGILYVLIIWNLTLKSFKGGMNLSCSITPWFRVLK